MNTLKTLAVDVRQGHGKGENRRLRQEDLVPGVFYSSDGQNISVQMPALPLSKLFSSVGRTTVFNLEINDNDKKSIHPVLIWQAQRHPVKSHFTHIDFYGVDLEKPVKITVPIEFTGVARGTKVGGRLETYREQVRLLAKPLDMPAKVVIDINTLDLNQTIHVADIKLPEGVQAAYDTNFAIVAVIMPGGADEGEAV